MLLPNVTHLIQPLNLSLMGSIKTNYQECLCKWLQNNPGGVCDKNTFIEVIQERQANTRCKCESE